MVTRDILNTGHQWFSSQRTSMFARLQRRLNTFQKCRSQLKCNMIKGPKKKSSAATATKSALAAGVCFQKTTALFSPFFY